MFLSDSDIDWRIRQGSLLIEPYDPRCLQPASYDIHLGSGFRYFRSPQAQSAVYIDPQRPDAELLVLTDVDPYLLPPWQFVLGTTQEKVDIPSTLVCRLEGKSSIGRQGLLVHLTAGFIDPGFYGHLTLELYNASPYLICLTPGMAIAQLSFAMLKTAPRRLYGHPELGSRYQGQGALPEAARGTIELEVP